MLPFLTWLVEGGVGPALVALPVTWAASDLAKVADRWFRRQRRSDGLGSIIRAAMGGDVHLTNAEFVAVRRLLTQESTWVVVGRGTVEDLASMIESCLSGRASADSLAVGKAIAAGLLEFAVRDLEPEWFRQVLLARMDRLQADQARVLDQLPPSPADEAKVKIYLAKLISWLDTDPWPEDARFGGRALTPSAIERKLRIMSAHGDVEQELDADDLAKRCTRLVVLGGPGSGKTWLPDVRSGCVPSLPLMH